MNPYMQSFRNFYNILQVKVDRLAGENDSVQKQPRNVFFGVTKIVLFHFWRSCMPNSLHLVNFDGPLKILGYHGSKELCGRLLAMAAKLRPQPKNFGRLWPRSWFDDFSAAAENWVVKSDAGTWANSCNFWRTQAIVKSSGRRCWDRDYKATARSLPQKRKGGGQSTDPKIGKNLPAG